MKHDLKKHICGFLFSLILIFSMNLRGFSAYTDYVNKVENKQLASDLSDDNTIQYSNTNSSEENENQGSNWYEILEKINNQLRYSLNINDDEVNQLDHKYHHLDLYSLLKPSLNTPPPELG